MKRINSITGILLIGIAVLFSIGILGCDGVLSFDPPPRDNPDDPAAESQDKITAVISVTRDGIAKAHDGSVIFDNSFAGGTAITLNFIITNSGDSTLYLTGSPLLIISGTSASAFSVTDPADDIIEPSESTTFSLTFTPPDSLGLNEAVLTIACNIDDFILNLSADVNITMTAPTGLSVINIDAYTNSLSWIDNSNNEAGFSIERKTALTVFAEVGTVNADISTYTDTGCEPDTAYTYRVLAHNGSGGVSDYSNEAAVTTGVAIQPPSGLSVTNVDGYTNDLSWTDNSENEDGFTIERSTNGTDYTELVTSIIVTSYTDSTCSPEISYWYRVIAYTNSPAEVSLPSAAGTVTTGVAIIAPSSLSVSNLNASTNNISWTDNSENEDGFTIERSIDGTTFAELQSSITVTSYSDTSCLPETRYWYRVFAFTDTPAAVSLTSNISDVTTIELWTVTTLDGQGADDIGKWSTLSLDGSGNPHVVYYDDTANRLKYQYYNGSAWVTVSTTDVWNGSSDFADQLTLGQYSSIAVDKSSGDAFVSCLATYTDNDTHNPVNRLRYAKYDGSSWSDAADMHWGNDPSGGWWSSGQWSGIDLDTSGNPGIVHFREKYDPFSGTPWDEYLLYSKFGGAAWSAPDSRDSRIMVAVNPADTFSKMDLDFDDESQPHIIYYDDIDNGYQYSWYDGTWNTAGLTVGTSDATCTMAVDSNEVAHFAWRAVGGSGGEIYYKTHDGTNFSSNSYPSVFYVNTGYRAIAIDLNSSDQPGICFGSGSGLSAVEYTFFNGTGWEKETIESGLVDDPDYFSMEYDSLGRVHLVYYDNTSDSIKYARRNDW